MSFYDAIRVGASGATGYQIDRSLRFNGDDDAYLARTIASTGNRKTFTFSGWVKRSNLTTSAVVRIFNCNISTNPSGTRGQRVTQVGFLTDDRIYAHAEDSSDQGEALSTAVYRDPAAWMHLLYVVDTTESAAADRIKVFVNGEQITLNFTNNVALNADTETNLAGNVMSLGAIYFNGVLYRDSPFYLAEANFIDGQALTPSSFTETDDTTGQLIPKKYVGTYGTNGFYLNFSDNSGTTATTLGKDSSGNGNNFTPYNFSVAAGAGNDSVEDTPTNNFPTFNPLSNGTGAAPSNGNLDFATTSSATGTMVTTIPVSSGKWYCEATITFGSNNGAVGIREVDQSSVTTNTLGNQTLDYAYRGNGQKFNSNSKTSYGSSYTTNDVIGIALDLDGGTIKFFKNNSDQGTAFSSITGTYVFAIGDDNSSSAFNGSMNFGQIPFTYTPPTGFKTLCTANLPDPTILLPNKHFDTLLYTANGGTQNITGLNFNPDWVWGKSRSQAFYHDLYDTVRGDNLRIFSNDTNAEASGFLQFGVTGGFALSAGGNINDGTDSVVAWNWNAGGSASKTYRVVVVSDSGNKYRFRNSANSATFAQSAVTLDLEEGGTYTFDGSDSTMASHPIKLSTTANGTHGGGSSYNTGVTYELDGSTVTESAYVSGYSSATSRKLIITVAASAPQLFYYCHVHSGMGGAINTNSTLGSSNFDGSIQTTVKANTTAGFSIVTYTGNGTGGATIGHGLGVAPDVLIVKNRGPGARIWLVYHSANTSEPATEYLQLDATAATADDNSAWNDTAPTSTVFSVGTSASSNNNSEGHVAYCFSEVAGYSKFGSYTANGSTDGAFVYTGFRPAWVLIKRSDSSGNWFIIDNKRDTFNEVTKDLKPNTSGSETDNPNFLDFLSNGFKLRTAGASVNSGTMIYLAFAESPFKNNRAR